MRATLSIIIISILLVAMCPFAYKSCAQTQGEPTVSLSPATYKASQLNETFDVNITISNVNDLWSWFADISWDPTYLAMVGLPQEGDFMNQAGSTLFISLPPGNGTIKNGVSDTLLSATGASGSGVLATLEFQAIKPCVQTSILMVNLTLEEPNSLSSQSGTPNTPITPTSTSSVTSVSLIILGPPTADAGPSQTVPQGSTVIFNGTNSVSSGQNPTYTWSFIDSKPITLNGEIANYTFNTPGNYNVTLTVQDSLGTGNDSVLIIVQDKTPPVAVIDYQNAPVSQSISVGVGQSITLDGSKSYDPENSTITMYKWYTGNYSLNNPPIGSNQTFSCAFTTAGAYTLTLIVYNAANLSNSTTITISVGQNSNQTSTPSPNSNNNSNSGNSNTNSGNSNTSASSNGGNTNLPPTIIGIIIGVTIITLIGSGFWLRKRT